MFAKAIEKVDLKNETWNPLKPTTIKQNLNAITISF